MHFLVPAQIKVQMIGIARNREACASRIKANPLPPAPCDAKSRMWDTGSKQKESRNFVNRAVTLVLHLFHVSPEIQLKWLETRIHAVAPRTHAHAPTTLTRYDGFDAITAQATDAVGARICFF